MTAGVLNRTDSDQSVCESLGIPHVVEAPFSPIGAPAREECEAMTAEADVLVIAPVPFGAGNLANLELASRAQEQSAVVYLLGPESLAGRDFTDGTASRLWDRLIAGGACSVPDVLALDTILSARNAVEDLSESRL